MLNKILYAITGLYIAILFSCSSPIQSTENSLPKKSTPKIVEIPNFNWTAENEVATLAVRQPGGNVIQIQTDLPCTATSVNGSSVPADAGNVTNVLGNLYTPNANYSVDLWPTQGWVYLCSSGIIQIGDVSTGDQWPADYPFYALYNTVRGILRVIYYNPVRNVNASSTIVSLSVKSSSSEVARLLQFNDQNQTDSNTQTSTDTNFTQNCATDNNVSGWNFADFNLADYDMNYYQSTGIYLNLIFSDMTKSNIVLSGSINGSSSSTGNTSLLSGANVDYPTPLNTVLNTTLSGLNTLSTWSTNTQNTLNGFVNNLTKFSQSQYATPACANYIQNTVIPTIFPYIKNISSAAGDVASIASNFIPGISATATIINSILGTGQNSEPDPIYYNFTVNLSGTITTSGDNSLVSLELPTEYQQGDFAYQRPLGVMTFSPDKNDGFGISSFTLAKDVNIQGGPAGYAMLSLKPSYFASVIGSGFLNSIIVNPSVNSGSVYNSQPVISEMYGFDSSAMPSVTTFNKNMESFLSIADFQNRYSWKSINGPNTVFDYPSIPLIPLGYSSTPPVLKVLLKYSPSSEYTSIYPPAVVMNTYHLPSSNISQIPVPHAIIGSGSGGFQFQEIPSDGQISLNNNLLNFSIYDSGSAILNITSVTPSSGSSFINLVKYSPSVSPLASGEFNPQTTNLGGTFVFSFNPTSRPQSIVYSRGFVITTNDPINPNIYLTVSYLPS